MMIDIPSHVICTHDVLLYLSYTSTFILPCVRVALDSFNLSLWLGFALSWICLFSPVECFSISFILFHRFYTNSNHRNFDQKLKKQCGANTGNIAGRKPEKVFRAKAGETMQVWTQAQTRKLARGPLVQGPRPLAQAVCLGPRASFRAFAWGQAHRPHCFSGFCRALFSRFLARSVCPAFVPYCILGPAKAKIQYLISFCVVLWVFIKTSTFC